MAESSISLLFNQLSILFQEEQKLLGGLRQKAEYIHCEIGQMRAFLRVADAKEENDPQLKEWVRQVREIAYDTEDVLERYKLRFPHYDTRGFNGYLKKLYVSFRNLKVRHQLAREFQTIIYRVDNASKSQLTYKDMYPIMLKSSSPTAETNTLYDGRGDALLLEETEVVGIEKPKKQLFEWISYSEYGLKVISVVGMAGLGKTTLVKKVYDEPNVKANFDHHVWITVSESFKIEKLLEDLISRLVDEVNEPPPQGLKAMNADNMREFIYNFLKNKNYIIVLDDIWRINAWEAIKYAFPRSNSSGRGCIIITTRFNNIGNAACNETNGHFYSLEPLPMSESKELLYKKAFQGKSCPHYLEQICANILKRCDGLPLAIVVIGGLLATKNNRIEEWEMFNHSLGLELEGDNLKRLSKLLSLSFYDLPYYLKACFIYLSAFPEDYVLEKATIIKLWIAEGFVEAKKGKTIEEIAEGYLNELFNRSLIHVTDTYVDGRPRNFHIHDLVREYIVSRSSEQNMIIIYSQVSTRWPDRIRRLALHDSIIRVEQIHEFKYLRSLLYLGSTDSKCEPILYMVLQSGCSLLKVLDLRRASLDAVPKEVFKLYHLEYLSLRGTAVKLIPKSIENLQNLEILDLKGSRVTKLPIEIIKLRRLRNLIVYRYTSAYNPHFGSVESFKAPYEIGKLLSLQKLCFIDVGEEMNGIKLVREIGKLILLQRLCITNLRRGDGKDFCSSLAKLTNLRSLNISSVGGEVMDLQYHMNLPFLRSLELQGRLERVPEWISSLNALTVLYLRWSKLHEDPLECLQGLPNLLILEMTGAYEGEGLCFKDLGFKKLKRVSLMSMDRLRWVEVEKGSMPQLEKLMLMNCKSMAELPVGIEHLTQFKGMLVRDMSHEFVQKLSKDKFIPSTRVHPGTDEMGASYFFYFKV